MPRFSAAVALATTLHCVAENALVVLHRKLGIVAQVVTSRILNTER